MKAAIVSSFRRPFQIQQIDIPVPNANEILVKIKASGCCHTDLHAIEGNWSIKPKMPLIPGHEGVGVVEAVGSAVSTWKNGDRVGIPWLHDSCGVCEHCLQGRETICATRSCTGYTVDGCFREFAIAKASHAVLIPQKLAFEQAAPILCAGVTAYKGLKETRARPGQFVAIVGAAGGLGNLAVQYARAMGLRAIALDLGAHKLQQCLDAGAEHFVDASGASDTLVGSYTQPVPTPRSGPEMDTRAAAVVEEVLDYTGGGAHGVLCLAPKRAAFELATSISRRRGRVACIGLPPGGFPNPMFEVALKRVAVISSIVGSRQDLQEALAFAARGQVHCIVQKRPLEALNDIYSKLKKAQITGRVVITFD